MQDPRKSDHNLHIIIPGSAPGCRTGNREKLSSTQAEPFQAIKSGVAYFPSISCTTSWRRSRYWAHIILGTYYIGHGCVRLRRRPDRLDLKFIIPSIWLLQGLILKLNMPSIWGAGEFALFLLSIGHLTAYLEAQFHNLTNQLQEPSCKVLKFPAATRWPPAAWLSAVFAKIGGNSRNHVQVLLRASVDVRDLKFQQMSPHGMSGWRPVASSMQMGISILLSGMLPEVDFLKTWAHVSHQVLAKHWSEVKK